MSRGVTQRRAIEEARRAHDDSRREGTRAIQEESVAAEGGAAGSGSQTETTRQAQHSTSSPNPTGRAAEGAQVGAVPSEPRPRP